MTLTAVDICSHIVWVDNGFGLENDGWSGDAT